MDKLRAGDKVRRKDVNRDWGWNSDCKHCSIKPYDVLTVSWLQGKDLIKLDELGEYCYQKRFFEKVKEENNVAQIKKGSKVQISDKSQSKYRGKVGVVTIVWSGVWTPTKHTHYSLELLVNSKVVKTKIIAKNVELFKEVSTFKVGDIVTIIKGSRYDGEDFTCNPKHGVVGVVEKVYSSGQLKVKWPKGNNNYSPKDLKAVDTTTFKVGDSITLRKDSSYAGTDEKVNPSHGVVGLVAFVDGCSIKVTWQNGHNWYSPFDLETINTFKVGDKVTIRKGSQFEGQSPTNNPSHGVVGVVAEIYPNKVKVNWPTSNNYYSMKDLEAAPVVTTVRKYVAASLGNKSQTSLQTYEEALAEVKRLQLASPHKVYALVEVLETAKVIVSPPVVQMNKVS